MKNLSTQTASISSLGIGTTSPTMSLDVPDGMRIGNIVYGPKIYKFRTPTAGSGLDPTLRFLIPTSAGSFMARFRMVGLYGFYTNYYFHRDIVLCGYSSDYADAYGMEMVQDTYHWNSSQFNVQFQLDGDPSTGQMYIDMSFDFSQNYRVTLQTEWMSEIIENGSATTPFQVVGLMLSGADDSNL
jgi:hypothetical protein